MCAVAAEVLRIRILKKLQTILSEVDGFRFGLTDETGAPLADLSGRVFRGRARYGADDPLPMLSILEVPIPLDQIAPPPDSSYSNGTWELLIQGFVADDKEVPTDPAHVLMAAVKKRLAEEKRKNADFNLFDMGPRHVTDMRIGAGVVRPPDEVSEKAYFWLNLALDVVENLNDPFED